LFFLVEATDVTRVVRNLRNPLLNDISLCDILHLTATNFPNQFISVTTSKAICGTYTCELQENVIGICAGSKNVIATRQENRKGIRHDLFDWL